MSNLVKVDVAQAKKILGWPANMRNDIAIDRLIDVYDLTPADLIAVAGDERIVTWFKRDTIQLRDRLRDEEAAEKAKTAQAQLPLAPKALREGLITASAAPEPKAEESSPAPVAHMIFQRLDNIEQRQVRIEARLLQIEDAINMILKQLGTKGSA